MSGTTRAQFLGRGAKGGLALVAGGLVLGVAEGTAFGAMSSDTDLAKLAATAELLAIDFYGKAIASKHFKGDELATSCGAQRQRGRALRRCSRASSARRRRQGLRFKYPNGVVLVAPLAIATLGQALETAFLGTYLGAVAARSEQRAEEPRGRDRRERVAAPERAHEHRRGRDRPGAGPAARSTPACRPLAALKPFLA